MIRQNPRLKTMKKILLVSFCAMSLSAFSQVDVPAPVIPEAQAPELTAPRPSVVPEAVSIPQAQLPAVEQKGETTAVYGLSFKEAWQYGGWIMWVLLSISVFAVTLVIYFLAAFRVQAIVPRRLVSSVRDAILDGDDNSARRLCDNRNCAFSSIVLTALDCVRATKNESGDLLRDLVQSEGSRHVESMQSQTQLLLDLAAIAPMIGLLGTTLGMLQAFGSIAQDVVVAAKPVILAQGVSKAIVTTIAGLLVAIPCMGAYAVSRRSVMRISSVLESATAEILTAIAARRSDAAAIAAKKDA